MGVRAKCSRCDYLRTFADELRGTFYRCPKCRDGVIAVPKDGKLRHEPSDEAPRVQAARTADNRSSEEVIRETEEADDAAGDEGTDPDPAAPTDETPRGAFFGAGSDRGAHAGGADGSRAAGPGGGAGASDTEALPVDAADDGADEAEPVSSGERARRGKPVKVRRILVECALCGHHVAVPPQFFGKTVHCPECRADMMFSESSLEPVKDEIVGRIAMEQAERRVLQSPVPGPIASPEAVKRARRQHLAIVVLVAALATTAAVLGWKLMGARAGVGAR